MMASRGMGAVNPAKIRSIKKRDGDESVKLYKEGGKAALAACKCKDAKGLKK